MQKAELIKSDKTYAVDEKSVCLIKQDNQGWNFDLLFFKAVCVCMCLNVQVWWGGGVYHMHGYFYLVIK